jgi:hypothetical protein
MAVHMFLPDFLSVRAQRFGRVATIGYYGMASCMICCTCMQCVKASLSWHSSEERDNICRWVLHHPDAEEPIIEIVSGTYCTAWSCNMDWPALDLELSESHFEYFEYGHRMSTIVRKLAVDEVQLNSFGNRRRSDSLCSGASSLGIAVGSRMG